MGVLFCRGGDTAEQLLGRRFGIIGMCQRRERVRLDRARLLCRRARGGGDQHQAHGMACQAGPHQTDF